MSNLSKKAAIKEKRKYGTKPSNDLKRAGASLDMKSFLLKKLKNNEGEASITKETLEKEKEKNVIRISTSGKSNFLLKEGIWGKKVLIILFCLNFGFSFFSLFFKN